MKRGKRKSGKKSGGAKGLRTIGGRQYYCHTKRVKNARGGKKSVRAYCRKEK